MTTYSMTKADLQKRIDRGDFGSEVRLSAPHNDIELHLVQVARNVEYTIGWYNTDTQVLEL